MSGSILKWWWNGVTYDVKSDADLTENPEIEVEGIATSGKTLRKRTKVVATVEGIDVIVSAEEKIALKNDVRNNVTANGGYKEDDGTVNNMTGTIGIVSKTTQENTMAIVFIPDGVWETTPA